MRIFAGCATLAGARLIIRVLDVVRLLTIARWLGPAEMGVYAVAALVVAALEQLSETGMRAAMIQHPGNILPYVRPVRTLQIFRGLFLGLIVFISAPWISSFFDSPQSLSILQVAALLPIVRGLEPLYVTLAQKELQFLPVVALQCTASIVGFFVGLSAAYLRPDAWALLWSTLATLLVNTVGAHFLSDRKALGVSFQWGPLKDIRRFGFWIFMNCVISYLYIKGGDWVIGHLLDVKTLALYQIAFLTSTTLITEIGAVFSQLALPVFSQLQQDHSRLRAYFSHSFAFLSLFTLPVAGLIVTCSPDFYHLVLGQTWLPALPLVPCITLWGVCSVFSAFTGALFQALGRPKLWTATVFIMLILFTLAIYPIIKYFGAIGVSALMAAIGVAMQLVRYWLIGKLIAIPTSKLYSHILMPIIACIISILIATYIRSLIPLNSFLHGLIITFITLAIVYPFVLFIGKNWMEPSPSEIFINVRIFVLRFLNKFTNSRTII